MSDKNEIGKIGWIDITVDDAAGLRDFYKQVVGWKSEDVNMGDYSDYSMSTPGSAEVVTGICHARDSNAELKGGWLVYITVANIEESAAACKANGGKVLLEPRALAGGQFCVIEDPSGATAALYQA